MRPTDRQIEEAFNSLKNGTERHDAIVFLGGLLGLALSKCEDDTQQLNVVENFVYALHSLQLTLNEAITIVNKVFRVEASLHGRFN